MIIAVLFASLTSSSAPAQSVSLQPPSIAAFPSKNAAAVEAIRRAADALGGDEIFANLQRLEFGFEGKAYFPHQGVRPEVSGEFNYRETTRVDLVSNNMEVVSGFDGGETVFTSSNQFDGTQIRAQGQFARQLRQSPHAVIKHWLSTPKNIILSQSTPTHEVVSGTFYGILLHAFINRRSHLLDKVVLPFDDVRMGNSTAVYEYLDYSSDGRFRRPGRIRLTEGGRVILDLPYATYSNEHVAVIEKQEEQPRGERAPEQQFDLPSADTFLHRDFGQVRVLFNTGGPDYHSLAVRGPNGVVIIEAPGSVADGKALAQRAAEFGPILQVAATHHHGDHSGGIAGLAAKSRQLVVADEHNDFFANMIAAERHFLAKPHKPVREMEILSVPPGGSLELENGVIAFDAGPSGHVDQHLVFYVISERLLFQTDMAVFRWDGSVEDARTQTCHLAKFIKKRKLNVETIVGGHGRPGLAADLQRAIDQRKERCPD